MVDFYDLVGVAIATLSKNWLLRDKLDKKTLQII
jgi:hypothetical protein